MSGYVASGRIVSAAPRLARADRRSIGADDVTRPTAGPAIVIEAGPNNVARPGPIVERLHAARERWSQLTFFLFDPNSWRS